MEKQLSSAQRDQLLITEAEEDAQFRKDVVQAMRESTASFTESIKSVSDTMMIFVAGVCKSIETLSHVMQGSVVRPPMHHNFVSENQLHHAPQSFEVTYTQLLGPPNQQDPGGNGNFYC